MQGQRRQARVRKRRFRATTKSELSWASLNSLKWRISCAPPAQLSIGPFRCPRMGLVGCRQKQPPEDFALRSAQPKNWCAANSQVQSMAAVELALTARFVLAGQGTRSHPPQVGQLLPSQSCSERVHAARTGAPFLENGTAGLGPPRSANQRHRLFGETLHAFKGLREAGRLERQAQVADPCLRERSDVGCHI